MFFSGRWIRRGIASAQYYLLNMVARFSIQLILPFGHHQASYSCQQESQLHQLQVKLT